MRPPPSTLALLCLLAFLAQGGPAFGRDATGGAAPVSIIKPATQEDLENPAIGKPKEPGVDCYKNESAQDAGNIREKAQITQLGKPCLPQRDAFKRAAEAASYLAFYQQQFSDYGMQMRDPKQKAQIEADVRACLNGDRSCDPSVGTDDEKANAQHMRAHLFSALVQYNFGKDLRAQLLESQTRAENMKTIDISPQDLKTLGIQGKRVLSWNNKLKSAPVRENTFRLDPSTIAVYDPQKLSAEQRLKLGSEFNQTFNQFVDSYTSSTGQRGPKSRWAYVPAKGAGQGGANVWVNQVDYRNLDPREGKALVDKGRLERDVKTQNSQVVEEIVAGFREDFKDVIAKPTSEKITINQADKKVAKSTDVDSMQRAYEIAGFGLPQAELQQVDPKSTDPTIPKSPTQVAQAVVVTINKAINDKEMELARANAQNDPGARFPSSAPGPGGVAKAPIISSVTVDIPAFDRFLDDIWPTGAPPKP